MKRKNADNGFKVPVGQALQVLNTCQKLASAPFADVMLAYAIGKTLAKLQMNPDVLAAETARGAIAKKHAGDLPNVPKDKLAAFSAELTPVFMEPVKLDIKRLPVTVPELAKEAQSANIPLSALELMALEEFCKKEETEA